MSTGQWIKIPDTTPFVAGDLLRIGKVDGPYLVTVVIEDPRYRQLIVKVERVSWWTRRRLWLRTRLWRAWRRVRGLVLDVFDL